MIFDYILLKNSIKQIDYTANNMMRERKIHDYIRDVGYIEDYEQKLKKKFPKTFKKYEEAKERWYKAFDCTNDEYIKWKTDNEYKYIINKQNRLEEMEKEINIIKEDIKIQKKRLEYFIDKERKTNNVQCKEF